MEDKVQEHDRAIERLEGRVQTLEQRLIDFAKFVDGGFTRGNLHPPVPADPTHDEKEEQFSYRCCNAAVYQRDAAGDAIGGQVAGCGAVINRYVKVNKERVPDEVVCSACGTIAKRIEDDK